MHKIIINGDLTDQINVQDRGLQYGDGLFETIAIKNNALQLWRDHLERMAQGCKRLGLPVVSDTQWLDDIKSLAINDADAVIKLIITRGVCGRGYKVGNRSEITRVVSVHDCPAYPVTHTTQGVNLMFCKTQASINSTLAGIKHLNKLENVLARNEWSNADIQEGLMLDDNGHVIEGTMSNVFAVNNNVLYTPVLDKSGVKGVVRNNIINIAHQNNIKIEEVSLSKEQLLNMDEIFISNSLIGIWPVIKLQDKCFQRGSVTSLLVDKLDLSVGAIDF